jgi:hypothetical protein
MGVFLVNTLFIRLCAFFSFVFAINSLTLLPNNCFAVTLDVFYAIYIPRLDTPGNPGYSG